MSTGSGGGARWVVTGSRGQLGRCLTERLERDASHRLVAALDRAALDLERPDTIEEALAPLWGEKPDVIVNAAAFTHVDACESEPERSRVVNAFAPGVLAAVARRNGARFVHVSTDYVFDGRGTRPYTEEDPTAPLGVYGTTKHEGEQRVREAHPDALVVRSSWIYGPGRNFVVAILGQARRVRAGEIPGLRVVSDQKGRPTYAADLAAALVQLVEAHATGLYHVANSGIASWWDFARAALDAAGFGDVPIEPVTTAEFPRPAPRPAWSVLDLGKAERAGVRTRAWPEALEAYLAAPHSPLREEGGRS